MKEKLLSIFKYLFFLILGAGILYLVFKGKDLNKMLEDLKGAEYKYLLASMVFGYAAYLFRADTVDPGLYLDAAPRRGDCRSGRYRHRLRVLFSESRQIELKLSQWRKFNKITHAFFSIGGHRFLNFLEFEM